MDHQITRMIKTVLISCAFSPQAPSMISMAYRFALSLEAHVHFVHVGVNDPEVRRRLNLLLEECGVKEPFITIKPGRADKVLLEIARIVKADLIIAGAMAHESTLVGIFGSVARRIVRQSTCSVLLLSQLAYTKSTGFQCVGANIDYNDTANPLLGMALSIAKVTQSPLHIMHQDDYDMRYLEMEEIGDDKRISTYQRQCSQVEKQRLDTFIEGFDCTGVSIRSACIKGGDDTEMVRYINENSIDILLTALSKEPVSMWQRFFNPEVEVILQDLPCSILFFKS